MTNKELLEENAFLKQKIQELEQLESERKHADAVLRESEERFKQLFDHITDGVAVYQGVDEGQDFVFVDINRAGQFLSRIHLDKAVGRRVTKVFPSVERMGLLDVFRRVWRTGQPEHHPQTEYADDRIVVQWVKNYVFKLPSGLVVAIYSDTTEEHRTEEALRQSEENFRHSLDYSPMGVRIVTIEGETIYANRAILDIHGYDSIEEFRTTPVKKRYTPESYAEFQIRRDKRKRGDYVPSKYEICIIRKDGEVRCLSIHRDEILWNGNKQFQVLYSDITEYKQSEEALREEAIRRRILIEQSRDGIVVLDQNGKVFEANRQFADLLGYSMEEVLQLHVWDWDTQWSRKQLLEMILTVNETGDHFETRHRRKDGTFYDVEISTNGAIFGRQKLVFCVCRDITERKQAEVALLENESRLKVALTPIDMAVFNQDLDLRYTWIYKPQVGYTTEQVIGKTDAELIPPNAARQITEIKRQVLESGTGARGVVEVTSGDLTIYYDLVVEPLRNPAGQVVGITGSSLNITERRLAESKLSESEKDYRTLFNAIDEGFCIIEMIFDENEKPVDYRFLEVNPSFYRQTELINAQGKRMRELAPKHEEHWFEIYGKIAVTGQPARFVNRAEQLHRWFDVYAFRVGQPEKRQVAILFNDITDRKRTEEALRESKERFRKLFESLPQLVWTCQPDGPCDFLSPQWVKYTGIPEVTQLGFGWMKQLHPDDREPTTAAWNSACASGSDLHVKFRIRRHDGVYHWFYTHAVLLRDHDGRPAKWYGSNTDINDLIQAEEALRESKELLRIVLNNAPITIFATDDRGVFTLSEGKNLEKVNLKPGENVGESALDLFGKLPVIQINGDTLNGRKVIQRVLAGETLTGITKLEDTYFDNQFVPYYDVHDKVIGMIGVATIITDRMRAEKELRASREQMRTLAIRLQQIREEERVMLSREIHDVMGGGLTGLKMDLSWLLHKMVDDADPCEERAALIDKIHASNALIDHMIHVVRRISTDLRPSVLDDLGLIAALEWQLSEFTMRTEIQHEFIKTFDYVYLEVDTSVAVFRIFQEALTNVMRHSRATKVVVVLLEGERSLFGDESLVLEIRDNGRGITEEEILNNDSLGLLGMKERVLTFGGEVSIYGEPGGGTALILKIPRKK